MSGEGALALMLDPASRVVTRVTVPEGLRLDETVKLLAAKAGFSVADLEKALADPTALGPARRTRGGRAEGYLYPATYDVTPDDTAASVLKAMVAQFGKVADGRPASTTARSRPTRSSTIASLVEAEARHAEDYGKVARVIYNRLAKKMPLQMDSTVNYALKADKEIVTFKDLEVESAYNTYKHPGLPPGPIGSPGRPPSRPRWRRPTGDWLYFVTVDPASRRDQVHRQLRRVPAVQAGAQGQLVTRCSDGGRRCWARRSPTRSRRCCTGRPIDALGLSDWTYDAVEVTTDVAGRVPRRARAGVGRAVADHAAQAGGDPAARLGLRRRRQRRRGQHRGAA